MRTPIKNYIVAKRNAAKNSKREKDVKNAQEEIKFHNFE